MSSSTHTEKDFDKAAAALYSQLHQSSTPAAINSAAARRKSTVHDMHTYLHRMGLQLNDYDEGNKRTAPDAASSLGCHLPPLIIHISGTKGKGSTLSYCESLLRNAYGLTTGMFTSPHLVCIRERIRINGVPVSKKVFAETYWTVRRKLEENSHLVLEDVDYEHKELVNNGDDGLPPLPILPGYFRMLTLMALYTFCHYEGAKLDVILLEVGMGGRYDATNVFEPYCSLPMINSTNSSNCRNTRVLVRGITLIDYDHTRVLGSTLEQIAWEKGGIFVNDKRRKIGMNDGGYYKFLNDGDDDDVDDYDEHQQPQKTQPRQQQQQQQQQNEDGGTTERNRLFVNGRNIPQVSNVLRAIARKEKGSLQLIQGSYLDSIPDLQFHASHQRENAALALAICQHAITQYYQTYRYPASNLEDVTKEQISLALNKTFWPGRCHTLSLPPVITNNGDEVSMMLRCDGAHTPISINACIRWFQSIVTSYQRGGNDRENRVVRKVLIFNCGHERNPIPLLYRLHRSRLFNRVYFCRADFERPSAMSKLLLDEWMIESLSSEQVDYGEECHISYEAICNATAKSVDRNDTFNDNIIKNGTWQETLANIWNAMDLYHSQVVEKMSAPPILDDTKNVVVGLKVVDAIQQIRNQEEAQLKGIGKKASVVEILVTGSLYLVGSALQAVGWEVEETDGSQSRN